MHSLGTNSSSRGAVLFGINEIEERAIQHVQKSKNVYRDISKSTKNVKRKHYFMEDKNICTDIA